MAEVKVIAVDFDGTLCTLAYPEIGKPNTALIQLLILVREQGAKLILWTCREMKMLDKAVAWCKEQGLEFDAINTNVIERIEQYGGNCRKVSADWYIDDKAISPEDFVEISVARLKRLMEQEEGQCK